MEDKEFTQEPSGIEWVMALDAPPPESEEISLYVKLTQEIPKIKKTTTDEATLTTTPSPHPEENHISKFNIESLSTPRVDFDFQKINEQKELEVVEEHPLLENVELTHEKQQLTTDELADLITQSLLEDLLGDAFKERLWAKNSPIRSLIEHPVEFVEEFKDVEQREDSKAEEELKVEQVVTETNLTNEDIKEKGKSIGIPTDFRKVDYYIEEIFAYIRESPDEFLQNIALPLQRSPLDILAQLQNAEYNDQAILSQQPVLPVDLYLRIEKSHKNELVTSSTDREITEEETNFLKECEHIHNKVIFDALNEALDNFRPFGLRGQPFPWSSLTRTLTYKNAQREALEETLKIIKNKVMEWAHVRAGTLTFMDLLPPRYSTNFQATGNEEELFNQIKEERLATILAADIEENEGLWTDYEYEETQVKLDVADMVLSHLTEETLELLTRIKEKRDNLFIIR